MRCFVPIKALSKEQSSFKMVFTNFSQKIAKIGLRQQTII